MLVCGQEQILGNFLVLVLIVEGDVIEKEVIVFGISVDYVFYEFYKSIDGKDIIVGFDIEIVKVIVVDMGVELKIEDMDFDGFFMVLDIEKVDFVILGLILIEEWKKNVDFMDIYYYVEQLVFVWEGEGVVLSLLNDLLGKQVGVQKSFI